MKTVFLLVDAAYAMTPDLMSRVHIAAFVNMLPK